MKGQQLDLKSLQKVFAKHSSFVFILFLLAIVGASIFSLFQIYDSNLASIEPQPSTIADFDQETIDRIKELRDSSDAPKELEFPKSRSNPFTD